jgi:hypothetical protein
MLVFYENPNTLSLPYPVLRKVEVRDSNGTVRLDSKNKPIFEEKEIPKYFKFVPGKNSISTKLWKEIVKYNEEDWDHYSTLLTVFRAHVDDKTGIEVGINEEKIDLTDLSTSEFKMLIKNTMDVDDLKRYKKFEMNRDKRRKVILDSIESMLDEISLADKEINKEK